MAIVVGPTNPPIPAGMIDYVGNAGTEAFLDPVHLQTVNGIAVDIPRHSDQRPLTPRFRVAYAKVQRPLVPVAESRGASA